MFHHSNLDIRISDIIDICNLEGNEFDKKDSLCSFVRPNIANTNDLTFLSSNKYSLSTDAKYIITNKKLSSYIDSKKLTLISNNLECDIAKISSFFYRSKTLNEISELSNSEKALIHLYLQMHLLIKKQGQILHFFSWTTQVRLFNWKKCKSWKKCVYQ